MDRKIVTRNDLLINNLTTYVNLSIDKERYKIKGIPTKDIDNSIEDKQIVIGKIIDAMSKDELNEASYQVETILNKFEEQRDKYDKYINSENYNFKSDDDLVIEMDFLENGVVINRLSEVLDLVNEACTKKRGKA